MGGLLLWPGLGFSLGELSRKGLEILGALTEGNSLKGLDKKNWLLSMGGLSNTCGLYSFLGCIRVLAFTRLSRTRRLAFLGWLLRRSYCRIAPGPAASAFSGASLTLELDGAASLMAGG